jgi:hypothetical protein
MRLMDRNLNIIAMDIPLPANYGGVIDVYFKLKSLHALGVKVHLHVYEYGRSKDDDLLKVCESVSYYPRRTTRQYLLHRKPYIVASRNSDRLINALCRNDYPILFEGLHTCYYLDHERLKDRVKIVRSHNVEHDYYRSLASVERNVFKQIYFTREADKLERFENVLKHTTGIAAISKKDTEYLKTKFSNVEQISAFHPHEEVEIAQGNGDFCLYHGSLDVGENNQAAMYLVEKVFSKCDHKLIIAGKKPSKELQNAVALKSNIELMTNLDTEGIHDLIRDAQINVLPTFQATGLKLKLLAALYSGRHCLVNTPMIENTGLEQVCRIEGKADSMISAINELMDVEMTESDKLARKETLDQGFGNSSNAERLYEMIFGEKPEIKETSKIFGSNLL